MTPFASFAMIDWSSGNDTGPRPRKDAIWGGAVLGGREIDPVYLRNRDLASDWIAGLIEAETTRGRRLLIGFDFPFGYPAGFAEAVTGSPDPLALWDHVADRLHDTPRANTRFRLAGELNGLFPGTGPFWFNATKDEIPGLPRKGTARRGHGLPERREAERRAKGAFPLWQMGGAGAVGGQAMTGMAALARLRRRFPGRIAVWPFEPLDRPVAFVEIWPSLLRDAVRAEADPIPDRAQVRLMARALAHLPPDRLETMLDVDAPEEGWILGLGFEKDLTMALSSSPEPPPLTNDCFALPPGVDWTPVDDALERLRTTLRPVVGTRMVPTAAADGRILARDHAALRSNPPGPNAAVDGYGFAHGTLPEGDAVLPLVTGRAAAGLPFEGTVPPGHAIRILTGALLPDGVDTVVLEEDTRTGNGQVAFRPPKLRANTRKAGEDVEEGEIALHAGQLLRPPDIALAAAVGLADLETYRPLRVAVLSTGSELAEPGATTDPGRTFDANRPMLLSLLARWGFETLDLGAAPDDRAEIRRRFDRAGSEADALLTSGGASAGDEDHVSALLKETGSLTDWRIALKPGRPLALGLWNGTPVFGLPGNPVAALVCTLIFARPALLRLAGADWTTPRGFDVPAAFSKNKKPGRREYLRARLTPEGRAEVFKSEGSGRISGLSWAEGLVELGDGARQIAPGDPVRFLPYGEFGLA